MRKKTSIKISKQVKETISRLGFIWMNGKRVENLCLVLSSLSKMSRSLVLQWKQEIRSGILKPASEYRIFGQTKIFVSNIGFGFVCRFNVLNGFPNIRCKDASSGNCLWVLRLELVDNPLPQTWQICGFSPVWVLMCHFSRPYQSNAFPHTLHGSIVFSLGLRPGPVRWIRMVEKNVLGEERGMSSCGFSTGHALQTILGKMDIWMWMARIHCGYTYMWFKIIMTHELGKTSHK